MIDHTFDRVARAWSGMRRLHRAGRTMAALGRLDDRTLRDIGIDRSQIPGIAYELAVGARHDLRRRA